jgi:hypothetical protein
VPAESYFLPRLRGGRCVLAPVRLGWAGRNCVGGVDPGMSVAGLTEADEMVFFPEFKIHVGSHHMFFDPCTS